MKLKSFKIFESTSKIQGILPDILADLIDEFDPEIEYNLDKNESIDFEFEFANNKIAGSNADSVRKYIEYTQYTMDVYKKFYSIMKKLDQEGFNCKLTEVASNNVRLIVRLFLNNNGGLPWVIVHDNNGLVEIDCDKLNTHLNTYSQELDEVTIMEDDGGTWVYITYKGLGYSGEDLSLSNKLKLENELMNTYVVDTVNFNNLALQLNQSRQIELFVARSVELIDPNNKYTD